MESYNLILDFSLRIFNKDILFFWVVDNFGNYWLEDIRYFFFRIYFDDRFFFWF